MYCGTIYDETWQTKMFENGTGPLSGKLFRDYQISTGVCKSPECLERYQQQLDEIKGYRVKEK